MVVNNNNKKIFNYGFENQNRIEITKEKNNYILEKFAFGKYDKTVMSFDDYHRFIDSLIQVRGL